MALPLTPIAMVALRYGAVALTAYAVARSLPPARFDQRAHDLMDELDEGVSVGRDPEHMHGAGRFRRTIRVGHDGPGLEIDVSAFGRIRVRKV